MSVPLSQIQDQRQLLLTDLRMEKKLNDDRNRDWIEHMERLVHEYIKLLVTEEPAHQSALEDPSISSRIVQRVIRKCSVKLHALFQQNPPVQEFCRQKMRYLDDEVPHVLREVLRGKLHEAVDTDFVREMLATYDTMYALSDQEKLQRVLTAEKRDMKLSDMVEFLNLYNRFKIQPHEVGYIFTEMEEEMGDELQALGERGVFIAPAEADEAIKIPKLIKQTQDLQKFDAKTQPEKRFEKATVITVGLFDRDKRMIANAVVLVSPWEPEQDQEYKRDHENLLNSGQFGPKFERRFRKGKIAMVLFIAGDAKYGAAFALSQAIDELRTLRPDIEIIWSYFLHDVIPKMGEEIFPEEESHSLLQNYASAGLLHGSAMSTKFSETRLSATAPWVNFTLPKIPFNAAPASLRPLWTYVSGKVPTVQGAAHKRFKSMKAAAMKKR